MPGPKLFGITGRVVHETARVHKLLARHGGGVAWHGPAQQLSIWTIESLNISRDPYVDLHVDVCIDCAFFVASGRDAFLYLDSRFASKTRFAQCSTCLRRAPRTPPHRLVPIVPRGTLSISQTQNSRPISARRV